MRPLTFQSGRNRRVYNIMNKCKYCHKETSNPSFCSKSCSTTMSNLTSPKRKRIVRLCRTCKILPRTSRSQFCEQCKIAWARSKDPSIQTIGSIREKYRSKGIHRSHWLSELRGHCRAQNLHREKQCQVCGYSTHIEYSHIKAVSSYDDNTTVKEVNSPDNILILCPNHHWEFDNGILTIESIVHT